MLWLCVQELYDVMDAMSVLFTISSCDVVL